ncbi:MAG: trimethylamine methyltransferase family protein [Desulfobacterales bacterium]|jgi:trimethylamine--corrinoid protein Co-methyltransferase
MNETNIVSFSSPYYRRLSKTQIEHIHHASLEILERTGVRLPNDEAIALLKKGDAYVTDNNVVHIPAWRVEWALNLAPKQIILYDQTAKPAIRMTGRKSYYGNGSDLINIIDHRNDERRKPVLQDVQNLIRLLDALPNFNFIMSGFIPSDVASQNVETIQTLVMLKNTNKPLVYVTTDLANTQREVEMFEIAAGGSEEFRRRPFAACYINIAKPLMHNPESVEKLLFLGRIKSGP